MQTIKVTYETQVPDSMTDEQITEYLIYALDERGDVSDDNPKAGCGAEPFVETISFTRVEETE